MRKQIEKRIKILKKFFGIALIISASSVSLFAETQFSGKLNAQAGTYLPWSNMAGKLSLADLSVQGCLDGYWGNSSVYVNGTMVVNGLEIRHDSNFLNFISGNEALKFKLNEAYFDYNGGWWAIRAGRQIVNWGAADSFVVANLICPNDNSKLNGTDINDSKLGIDTLRLSVNTNSILADFYWIPVFTPSALPLSATNPLYRIMIPESIDLTAAGIGKLGITNLDSSRLSRPELSLANGEYGLRISSFFSFGDISLYGFYGWDDEPCIGYDLNTVVRDIGGGVQAEVPASISLNGSYNRVGMIGADASVPVGPVTIRSEVAFFPMRTFAVKAQNQFQEIFAYYQANNTVNGVTVTRVEKHNQFTALLGFDWMPSDWTISAQYYGDLVFGNTENLERKQYNHQASLSVSYSLLGGNMSIGLNGIIGLNDFDSAIIPEVTYSISDQLSLKASAMIFNEGKEKGTYGNYKNLSSFSIGGTFSF